MKQKNFCERRCARASDDVCRQKFPFGNFYCTVSFYVGELRLVANES